MVDTDSRKLGVVGVILQQLILSQMAQNTSAAGSNGCARVTRVRSGEKGVAVVANVEVQGA